MVKGALKQHRRIQGAGESSLFFTLVSYEFEKHGCLLRIGRVWNWCLPSTWPFYTISWGNDDKPCLVGGWAYTSEKWWSSSVGMMKFPIWWENPLKSIKPLWSIIPNWMESHKIPWFQSPPTRCGFWTVWFRSSFRPNFTLATHRATTARRFSPECWLPGCGFAMIWWWFCHKNSGNPISKKIYPWCLRWFLLYCHLLHHFQVIHPNLQWKSPRCCFTNEIL